ncbi:class 1 isoprenoid biosynthesis enzyme [Natronolimnohabitans innermongolicus]|uniref:Polyprenyl synthetase n=1 Tax=Natronolimnohabitans innermongolicus JCM 12255 TaxID=1227499 RepID=L9XHY5_9EURY|nr:class 1 isoprenoid biosynthesis enzyme [Natronolimnohabitans innermongolicus]ELY61222.1 hypothetical protein C493_02873 [Natronolimnohabitans innermongolicus JCM 12255]
MGSSLNGLLDARDLDLSPAVRATARSYADQGGLLGAFVYALVDLETDDPELAAALASIPTDLFAASSLHDDAIDESGTWDARHRKRRLNERVTLGDLAFVDVVETAAALPSDVDLGSALETVRQIGAGQLREESVDPATATLEDALGRLEDRGAVWGDLATALVDATGGYSSAQLEALHRLASEGMVVLAVLDDVEDLPTDVDNGVATVPRALYDGDLAAADSTDDAVEAFLASGAPTRLEALLAERSAALEAATLAFSETLYHSDAALLAAVRRALSWYCGRICSVPVERTVPENRQRALRAQLAGPAEKRRETIASAVAESPIEPSAASIDLDAAVESVVDLPPESLADVLITGTHAATIFDDAVATSLPDALESLERCVSTDRPGSNVRT